MVHGGLVGKERIGHMLLTVLVSDCQIVLKEAKTTLNTVLISFFPVNSYWLYQSGSSLYNRKRVEGELCETFGGHLDSCMGS